MIFPVIKMKLMILDGNSIVNRAYYGVRPLIAPDGLHTHAIYGFLMIRDQDPEKKSRTRIEPPVSQYVLPL